MNRHVNAVTGCRHASKHAADSGDKPWKYLAIPCDTIAGNMSIKGFFARFS